ncbi:LutC/YkgG family protein [Anseongella ginsenosidimutans]|nr:LUD domain-containing protein [Anseongella ginsenosidimutans]
MGIHQTREIILKKIRMALLNAVEQPYPGQEAHYPVFETSGADLCEQFASEFRALQGEVIFCKEKKEFVSKLEALVSEKKWTNVACLSAALTESLRLHILPFINAEGEPDAGITGCEFLIARTGTVAMSSGQSSGRAFSVYSPVHIVLAERSQVLPDLEDAFEAFGNKFSDEWPSALFFASGPSRTGDIEKTLVLGVHGPIEVYVFILDDKF